MEARGFIIIDDKYVVETGTATELIDGILSTVFVTSDTFDGGTLAALIAEEIEAAEGVRPQVQRWDRSMNYYPYRVVEIDTTTQRVFDGGEVNTFGSYD
jgi:hypothetical protein